MKANGLGAGQNAGAVEVEMNDWDIVNATTFEAVNAGIKLQGKTPSSFSNSSPGVGVATFSGDWDTWRVVRGGGGETVQMAMPVKKGSARYPVMEPSYAVLSPPSVNPSTKDKVTESGDGLGLIGGTLGGNTGYAASTITRTKGKVYFEVRNLVDGSGVFVGLGPKGTNRSIFMQGDDTVAYRSNGFVFAGGSRSKVTVGGATVDATPWNTANAVVGVAIDFDAKKVWLRSSSGAWEGDNADPVAGTGAFATIDPSKGIHPFVGVFANGTAQINLGASAFSHAVPTGFEAGLKVSDLSERTSDLEGAVVNARLTLTLKTGSASTRKLMVDDTSTPTTLAVEVVNVILSNGVAAPGPVAEAFETWLTANIDSFGNVFHEVDFSGLAAKTAMPWMKAKHASYAVVDYPRQDPPVAADPEGVFAVLVQTDKSTVNKSQLASQVAPSLLDGMAVDENAVVAISAERLTQQILLPGAMAIPTTGEDAGFVLGKDKREITNSKSFKLPTSKLKGIDKEVQPIVPVNGMTMRIEGRRIKVAYSGLHMDVPDWKLKATEEVTFGFEQTLFLVLKKRTDGHHILEATFQDPLDPKIKANSKIVKWENVLHKWTASVKLLEPDHDRTGLILAIVGGCLGVLVGVGIVAGIYKCMAGGAMDAAVNGVDTELSTGAQIANAELPLPPGDYAATEVLGDLSEQSSDSTIIYEQLPPDPQNENLQQAVAEDRMLAAGKPKVGSPTALMNYARFAVGFSALSTTGRIGAGDTLNMSDTEIGNLVKGDFDSLALRLTVEKFLEEALKQFDWPMTKGFELKSSALNGALLLRGKFATNTITTKS